MQHKKMAKIIKKMLDEYIHLSHVSQITEFGCCGGYEEDKDDLVKEIKSVLKELS